VRSAPCDFELFMVLVQVRSGGGSRQQAEEEIAELEAELQAREQHLLDKKLRNNTFIRKVGHTDTLIT
jgi:hypothetical protein